MSSVPHLGAELATGVQLTDLQKRQVAITLDMFGAKGTLGKLNDNFSEDAVYETCLPSVRTARRWVRTLSTSLFFPGTN